jgi:hypothetical protein
MARWLAARKWSVHHIGLFNLTAASTLRALAGGALTALEWGIYAPMRYEVGDLQLPHLRRLRIRITQGTRSDILTLAPDFSRLTALEELRVDEGWTQVLLSPGCLPSSLTKLVMPGVLLEEFPPDLRRQLTALRELDLGR